MMDEKTALHTAARRYCMEHYDQWLGRYRERAFDMAHPEAQNIYPRYNILAAMLVDVESVLPADFTLLEDLRGYLVAAGLTADDTFTRPPHGSLVRQAMTEERAAFCVFIDGMALEDLADVAPLPYRRSLSQSAHAALWARLDERWGTREDRYWYPLSGEAAPPDVAAFQQAGFEDAVPPPILQRLLASHGVERVYELRQSGPEYEITLDQVGPDNGDAEVYWTAGDMEWIVYTSHEITITIGGHWLTAAVQAIWPEWGPAPPYRMEP